MSIFIKDLSARSILDSRGVETVEATLATQKGSYTASVPSGQSTGASEAKTVEVPKAVENINSSIKNRIKNKEYAGISELDSDLRELDGTSDKRALGANAVLPVSVAAFKALAKEQNQEPFELAAAESEIKPALPTPMMVMIEGGKHGEYKGVTWQEFLLNSSTKNGLLFQERLKAYLQQKDIEYKKGVEGGVTVNFSNNEQALEVFKEIFKEIPDSPTFSLDIAASYNSISEKMLDILIADSSCASIEDPYPEESWQQWQELMKKFANKKIFVGDDLVTTNPVRVQRAIELKACNGIIIKPNQIGSVSETIEVAKLAEKAGLVRIVSHRAGETEDSFIADLAVGFGARYLKAGAPTSPERVAKYNRIEEIKKILS